MTRAAWHFWVDVVLFLAFVALLASAALVQFVFPPGTQATDWRLWGLGYDQWSQIRSICLALFTIMTLVHLILQWSWVCNFVSSRLNRHKGKKTKMPDGVKTIYGVALLIVVLTVVGAFLATAAIMVQRAP